MNSIEIKRQIDELQNRKRGLTIQKKTPIKREIKTLFDVSTRTASKIIQRMLDDPNFEFGCSHCGWNETIGDLHHIHGRKIDDCDNHSNISYLCPNCHRKVHKGLIKTEDIVNLIDHLGDNWKRYWYRQIPYHPGNTNSSGR